MALSPVAHIGSPRPASELHHAPSAHMRIMHRTGRHTLGAAGGIEAAVCVKVMETGLVPPTINYENADPECDLNYTPNTAGKLDAPKAVVSDNLGFGGHNAALVFKAYP